MTRTIILLLLLVAAAPSLTQAGFTITLISGSEPEDSEMAVRYYGYGDRYAHAPDAQAFLDVINGTPASISIWARQVNLWHSLPAPYADALPVANLEEDPGNPAWGCSGLFGVPFDVPDTPVQLASIEFVFTVDNNLGGIDRVTGLPVQGLYMNGIALSGDTRFYGGYLQPRFFVDQTIFRDDIGPLLKPGEKNWLFMSVRDWLPHASLMFGSTIQLSLVPEPTAIATWSVLGVVAGLVSCRFRGRSTSNL